MKRIACCLLAAISCAAIPAWSAVRPRYGGTLRLAMAESLAALDPAEDGNPIARARITPLLFDTLVRVDAEGRGHPQLAVAWQSDRSFKRWQFWLRPGVYFSDGTPLTAAAVVASLNRPAPWRASADGEFVVIESDVSQPGVLAELALARNAVVRRGTALVGTGPFVVKSFTSGTFLELTANADSWGGRPFLDGVQIEFAKSLRDQMLSLQLGKVDLIEVGAEQIGKVENEGRKAQVSLPTELVAIVGGPSNVREALSLAVDRKAIQSVLLRGGSEAAGGILPDWMSGTGVLFPVQVDPDKGRTALKSGRPGAAVPAKGSPAKTFSLAYEAGDALARLLAERVALNAREVGLTIVAAPSSAALSAQPDLRLMRISLTSGNPGVALTEVAHAVGGNAPSGLSAPGEIYLAQKKLMQEPGIVPLFHLPKASLAGDRVRGFSADKLGGWSLESDWVEGP